MPFFLFLSLSLLPVLVFHEQHRYAKEKEWISSSPITVLVIVPIVATISIQYTHIYIFMPIINMPQTVSTVNLCQGFRPPSSPFPF